MNEAAQADIVYHAIAHHTRREILGFLRGGPQPVMQIAERFTISQPAISQQLRVLLRASLVRAESNGRQRIYRLNPAPLRQVQKWIGWAVEAPSGHVLVFRKNDQLRRGD